MAGVLNPYDIIKEAAHFVAINKPLLYLLVGIVLIICAYLLYVVYSEFVGLPKREKRFIIGRHSLANAIREELIAKIKKKKKKAF
jgi:hypothetical protein